MECLKTHPDFTIADLKSGVIDPLEHTDFIVNEVDGSNRVSKPSERTGKKINDRDIKRNSGKTWKTHTYDFVSTISMIRSQICASHQKYDTYIRDRRYVPLVT